MNKGQNLEREYSLILHKKGMPVLISPLLLREIGAGQVDLAIMDFNQTILTIYEIKSHDHLSHSQSMRLKQSSLFASSVLDCMVLWKLLVGSPCVKIKEKKT